MAEIKRCICGHLMTAAEWKHQWVCHRCGRTKPLWDLNAEALGLTDRHKLAADVYDALLKLGWSMDAAVAFLESIPDCE